MKKQTDGNNHRMSVNEGDFTSFVNKSPPFYKTRANYDTPNTLVMFSLTSLSLMFLVSFPLMAEFTQNTVVSPILDC